MLIYFVKKHFRARHQILKLLYFYDDKFPPNASLSEKQLHFNEIAAALNHFEKGFVLDNLDYLQRIKEITCTQEFDNSKFTILGTGRDSYIENRYVKEGIRNRLDLFYDFLKNVSGVLLLIIACYTFLLNIFQTQRNKAEIEDLKLQIIHLRKSVSSQKNTDTSANGTQLNKSKDSSSTRNVP